MRKRTSPLPQIPPTVGGDGDRRIRGTAAPMAGKLVPMVFVLAALGAGCSGERPQLLPPNTADPSSSTTITATEPEVANLRPVDCQTGSGPGPIQIAVDAVPAPAVPCTLVAAHQRVEFVNNTAEQLVITLTGSTSMQLAPAESFVSEPIGTVLQPGVNQIDVQPYPSSAVWFVEPSQNPLAGQLMGLSSLGDIELGQSPDAVTATLGDRPLSAADGPCYVGGIEQDPYSPLFTFQDGALTVIQVFTPGQLTRSEIGVGASEGDVLAAYGQQIETQPAADGDPNKQLLVFVPVDPADQVHRLVFVIENGQVISIRNGLTAQAVGNPGCTSG